MKVPSSLEALLQLPSAAHRPALEEITSHRRTLGRSAAQSEPMRFPNSWTQLRPKERRQSPPLQF